MNLKFPQIEFICQRERDSFVTFVLFHRGELAEMSLTNYKGPLWELILCCSWCRVDTNWLWSAFLVPGQPLNTTKPVVWSEFSSAWQQNPLNLVEQTAACNTTVPARGISPSALRGRWPALTQENRWAFTASLMLTRDNESIELGGFWSSSTLCTCLSPLIAK